MGSSAPFFFKAGVGNLEKPSGVCLVLKLSNLQQSARRELGWTVVGQIGGKDTVFVLMLLKKHLIFLIAFGM